ncbi:hypothetical protein FHW96_000153 [Novosphingobium sp. SG751A]|nr:hypothetical protein [Novosphingobium sp. SG751A]
MAGLVLAHGCLVWGRRVFEDVMAFPLGARLWGWIAG